MRRDHPRDRMPEGTAWNLVDYIPEELGAPLTKRGGWSFESANIASTTASAAYVAAGAYAPFAAGSKNCAIDEDGRLYTITSGGAVTDVGAAVVPSAPLAFHRNKLIITAPDGTTAPMYYNGSTLGSLAGSPPAAIHSVVYKDLTVLARTAAQPNYVYFSGDGDPTSWNTTDSWIAADFPVTGLAALHNALIVFSANRVEAIIGDTPPPGTNMSKRTLYEPGCTDARSVAIVDDTAFFANPTGLYQTDGAEVRDVTERGGMKPYWTNLFASQTSSWTIACGRIRDRLIVSVLNGATFVDAFMIHLTDLSWVRLSNIKTLMFWRSISAAPETYFGWRGGPYVGELSSMFSPSASVKNDADDTAVLPIVETPWYPVGAAKSPVKNVYALYDLRDSASDDPTITLSYLTSPEATSYTTVTNFSDTAYPLAETTEITRVRRNIRRKTFGIAMRAAQSNASADTRLYRIESDDHRREETRVAA